MKEKLRSVCVHDLLILHNDDVTMVIDDVRERLREKSVIEIEEEREEIMINSLSDKALSNSSNSSSNNNNNNSSSSSSNNKEKDNKVKSIGEQLCMKIVGEKVR